MRISVTKMSKSVKQAALNVINAGYPAIINGCKIAKCSNSLTVQYPNQDLELANDLDEALSLIKKFCQSY